jgi:thiamine-phosphate pyrophosphorylase
MALSTSGPLGRLHLITDTRPGRDPIAVVRAALRAGLDTGSLPVIQLRVEDTMTDRDAYDLAVRVGELCRETGATWLVNDRLDVALAAGAHGVHIGDDDLPVAAARRVLAAIAAGPESGVVPGSDGAPGSGWVLGATAREPVAARAHVAAGASYLGVGPAYESPTKQGLPVPIGPAGVAAVAAAVEVPVIAIGGVTAERVAELVAAGAYGVAVIGAVSSAADPYAATLELLKALDSGRGRP